jgi:sarcosine oxidase, subunit beta
MPRVSRPLHVGVLGAGIVGAAVAWSLARRGARVTVIDRAAAPAAGSTGRSAGGLRHQFSLAANVRFSRFGAERFASFATEVGADAGFRPVGYLFLVPDGDADRWAADRAMQTAEGARVERWSLRELAKRAPYVAPDGLAEASYGPDDGVLDPHAATLGYLNAARGLGASVHLDRRVVALTPRRHGWRVEARAGADGLPGDARGSVRWEVDRIVNATGAWAGDVAAMAGAQLPVVPSRRDVFVTSPMRNGRSERSGRSVSLPTPLIVDVATGVWWRSEGERLLFGRSNPAEPAGFRSGLDWSWFEEVIAAALPRFPFFGELGLDRRASWWGWYEVTPDHLPAIGEAPDAPGLFHAAGFSGHGVQHAPATGHALACRLLDGGDGGFDLTPFDPARFLHPAGLVAGERRVV